MGTELIGLSGEEIPTVALVAAIHGLTAIWMEPSETETDALQTACERCRQAIESGEAKRLLTALTAPAGEKRATVAIAELLASFIPPRDVNMKVFSRMLMGDVLAMKPTGAEIDQAAAQLRRTCKFTPSIAEVLSAIEDRRRYLQALAKLLRGIPGQLVDAEWELSRRAKAAE
jgi:hypothetical protein